MHPSFPRSRSRSTEQRAQTRLQVLAPPNFCLPHLFSVGVHCPGQSFQVATLLARPASGLVCGSVAGCLAAHHPALRRFHGAREAAAGHGGGAVFAAPAAGRQRAGEMVDARYGGNDARGLIVCGRRAARTEGRKVATGIQLLLKLGKKRKERYDLNNLVAQFIGQPMCVNMPYVGS